MDEWAEMLLPDLDSDLRKKVVDTCITNETAVLKKQGGILYPGLVETFKQLHSLYHLSILSNCGLGYIDTLIDYAKIRPYVDYQLCFGDNNLDKADNIPLLIQKNSLDKAVYIGDTDKDYQACLTANIPFIYATYGFGQVDNTRWTIDSLDQLPKVAAQVFALD
jgi:phosphoglycolate phosphatase